jgi:hypothetical protein
MSVSASWWWAGSPRGTAVTGMRSQITGPTSRVAPIEIVELSAITAPSGLAVRSSPRMAARVHPARRSAAHAPFVSEEGAS